MSFNRRSTDDELARAKLALLTESGAASKRLTRMVNTSIASAAGGFVFGRLTARRAKVHSLKRSGLRLIVSLGISSLLKPALRVLEKLTGGLTHGSAQKSPGSDESSNTQ